MSVGRIILKAKHDGAGADRVNPELISPVTVIKADTGPELEPAMPSGCNIRTSAMFIPTLKAITAILMPPAFASTSAAMADGLPIPPLLELITEYTIYAPVVATWFGSGKAGCSDGSAQSVLFSDPMALTLHTGGGSKSDIIIFVADDTNKRVCACNVTTGQVSMFAGWRKQIGPPAVHRTALLDVDFFSCRNVCVDPIRNRIFISDERTIRVVETTSTRSGRAPDVGTSSETRIRTLIGGDTGGYEDGIGLNARCHLPAGMVLTADAQTLIFADTNNMVIRSIDLRTEETKTFIGTGQRRNADGAGRAASLQRPRFLAWCKRTATPNEMLYVSCDLAVAKIDMRFLVVTGLKFKPAQTLDPTGLDITPSGHVIVSCYRSNCLWSFDPTTLECTKFAGSGKPLNFLRGIVNGAPLDAEFRAPWGLAVIPPLCCVAVVDANNVIRRIPAPAHFFQPPPPPPPLIATTAHPVATATAAATATATAGTSLTVAVTATATST